MAKNWQIYIAWKNIKERCGNPNATHYANYGGRGISICKEWEHDYEAFQKWSYESGYADGLSIDRIDNEKGYSPENCRWISRKEQANNKRNNHLLTYNGKTQTISKWAEETGLSRSLISRRIGFLKWSVERTLTEQPFIGKNQSYKNADREVILRGEKYYAG